MYKLKIQHHAGDAVVHTGHEASCHLGWNIPQGIIDTIMAHGARVHYRGAFLSRIIAPRKEACLKAMQHESNLEELS